MNRRERREQFERQAAARFRCSDGQWTITWHDA